MFLFGCNFGQQKTKLAGLVLESEQSSERPISLGNLIPEGGAVVNFWASWCEPCRIEMPQLHLLSDKLKDHGIAVILVSVDEDRFLFEEYLLKYPQHLAVFLTSPNNSPEVLPTTYVVNSDGHIIKIYVGVRDWINDDIVTNIIQLLTIAKNKRL